MKVICMTYIRTAPLELRLLYKFTLHPLYRANSFAAQFGNITDGIDLLLKYNNIIVSSFLLIGSFYRSWLSTQFVTFFLIYCFLPACKLNVMLSRSSCAQVERGAIMMGANKEGLPSLSNRENCSFCI